MGCDCCKIVAPKDYEKCQERRKKKHCFVAPCGHEVGSTGIGSNYTPPKKKRRKK